ncbi:hypothetical protein CFC21_021389 [Triticum aestivum]|uniref:F-box domain-containing protein n=2 Tax=Triticum aestivum TaxID=4565 RepID=A0A3B6BZ46_WHEAT|nr:hypothetical protein CFC21_021389 [Triticum aestivum]
MHGADRLSGLSDDLIASIISFLSAREAARTSALSRRWRPIWLGTDSLNLDSRSYGDLGKDHSSHHDGGGLAGIKMNYRLFSDACKFLGTAGRCGRIKKLSLTVEGCGNEYFEDVMGNSAWGTSSDIYDLMTYLLGAPPLRHIEELSVRFEVIIQMRLGQEKLTRCIYKLDPAVLPRHTLRVLDLDFCRLESPAQGGAGVSFPCLTALRLYRCSSLMQDLEGLVRAAAPRLRSMHIQDHRFYGPPGSRSDRFKLHSPSLTDLTLVDTSGSICLQGTELDTPCLRTFKYNTFIFTGLWMKSQPTKLARVDLTLQWIIRTYGDNRSQLVLPRSAQVWQFLGHFRHVKAIRFKVQKIWCIAVNEDAQHEHLVMLPGLERLELEGFADPDPRHATAIANLLHCCPVLRDLRIRILRDPYQTSYDGESNVASSSSDFDVSMDLFRRRFSKEMVPLMLDRDDDGSSRVAELPGLTGCRFNCLENHLKKVTLRFDQLKELDSFEVRLAKFFAENCMGLEALQIDDGKHNFLSHINWMVQKWRTDALEQRKQIIGRESADSSKQFRKRKGDTAVEHKVETKRNYRKQT